VLRAPILVLQVYTAVYYVLADLVMLSLYGYYKAKNWGTGGELQLMPICGDISGAGGPWRNPQGVGCPIPGGVQGQVEGWNWVIFEVPSSLSHSVT